MNSWTMNRSAGGASMRKTKREGRPQLNEVQRRQRERQRLVLRPRHAGRFPRMKSSVGSSCTAPISAPQHDRAEQSGTRAYGAPAYSRQSVRYANGRRTSSTRTGDCRPASAIRPPERRPRTPSARLSSIGRCQQDVDCQQHPWRVGERRDVVHVHQVEQIEPAEREDHRAEPGRLARKPQPREQQSRAGQHRDVAGEISRLNAGPSGRKR